MKQIVKMQGFFKELANGTKGPKVYTLFGMSGVDYTDCIQVEICQEDLDVIREELEPDGPVVFQILKAAPTFSSPMRLNEFFYDANKARKYCQEHANEFYVYERIKYKG